MDREYKLFIKDIIESMESIEKFVGDMTLKELKADELIYIGDAPDDLEVAKNAKADFIGVIPPYANKEKLKNIFKENRAKIILDDINDIIKVREKYLKKDREKQTNQDSRKESTENLYLQLKKYREEWTKLSSFLNSPAALNNFENIPAHDMRIPMRKKDEAKLLRNVYNNMALETKKIDEMLLDANFEKVKNDHEQT